MAEGGDEKSTLETWLCEKKMLFFSNSLAIYLNEIYFFSSRLLFRCFFSCLLFNKSINERKKNNSEWDVPFHGEAVSIIHTSIQRIDSVRASEKVQLCIGRYEIKRVYRHKAVEISKEISLYRTFQLENWSSYFILRFEKKKPRIWKRRIF